MINKSNIAAVVVLLAASAASAAELNWNQDVLGQFKSQLKEASAVVPAVSGVAAAQPGQQQPQVSILQAEALGSGALNAEDKNWDESVSLTLNNDGDRVGAEYTVCDPSTEGSDNSPSCDYLEFAFPGLRIDGKNVLWGGDVIGQVHKGWFNWGVKLAKGYKLSVQKTPIVVDRGFNRDHLVKVSVFLQKTGR